MPGIVAGRDLARHGVDARGPQREARPGGHGQQLGGPFGPAHGRRQLRVHELAVAVEEPHHERRRGPAAAHPDAHRRALAHAGVRRRLDLEHGAIARRRAADQNRAHRNAERPRRGDGVFAGVHDAVAHHHHAVEVLPLRGARELGQRRAQRGGAARLTEGGIAAEPRRERQLAHERARPQRSGQIADRFVCHLGAAPSISLPDRQVHAPRPIDEHRDARGLAAAPALEHRLGEQPGERQERQHAEERQGPARQGGQRRDREAIGPEPDQEQRQADQRQPDPGRVGSEMQVGGRHERHPEGGWWRRGTRGGCTVSRSIEARNSILALRPWRGLRPPAAGPPR